MSFQETKDLDFGKEYGNGAKEYIFSILSDYLKVFQYGWIRNSTAYPSIKIVSTYLTLKNVKLFWHSNEFSGNYKTSIDFYPVRVWDLTRVRSRGVVLRTKVGDSPKQ